VQGMPAAVRAACVFSLRLNERHYNIRNERDKHTPKSSWTSLRYIYRDPLRFMGMKKGLHDNPRVRMRQDLGRRLSTIMFYQHKANRTCHRIILDEPQSELGDLFAI
jgi:hypothetical protein